MISAEELMNAVHGYRRAVLLAGLAGPPDDEVTATSTIRAELERAGQYLASCAEEYVKDNHNEGESA